MPKSNYISAYLFCLFFCLNHLIFANEKDSTFQLESDDPILVMGDSLLKIKYFESIGLSLEREYSELDSIGNTPDSILEARLKSLDNKTPIPLDFNPYVKAFIDLYAIKRKELVSNVLGLSPRYYPMFEEELIKRNMPLELKHLAVVESALSPVARSRVGAQGLWQFMYRTGKMYGLNVDSYEDQRMDPYKATVAACEYMLDLYAIYGDWHLVLAAYNSGPGNVNKAIRRSGGKKTYWEIRRYLPRETRGYVPAFIAVNYVMNYYQEHGIIPSMLNEFVYNTDTIMIGRSLSFGQISSYIDIPVDQVKFLNPQYRLDYINVTDEAKSLCLPTNKAGLFLANEELIFADIRRKEIADSIAGKEKEELIPPSIEHVVRSGEFLGSIANKYHCTVRDIMQWNNKRSTRINPGERLTIFTKEGQNTRAQTTVKVNKEESLTEKEESSGKYQIHIVRSGDTLWDIAKEYNNTSVNELKRLNSNLNFKRLKPGMQVKVKEIG